MTSANSSLSSLWLVKRCSLHRNRGLYIFGTGNFNAPMSTLSLFSNFSSNSKAMSWAIALVLGLFISLISISTAQLQVGFYQNSCPNAESIVTSVVRQATQSDPTIPAALLRLHFHDCIVQVSLFPIYLYFPSSFFINLGIFHKYWGLKLSVY